MEQDFDFNLPDEDEEGDEGVGSIFDEAGEDEDFVSDDLFGGDGAEDDDMSDVDDDFSFGDLFGDEEADDDAKDGDDDADTSAGDLFGDDEE